MVLPRKGREGARKEAGKAAKKKEPAPRGEPFWTRTEKYFRGVYGELRKVHWPRRREVVIYTGVVLVSVAVVALLIWIVDSILSWIV
ncbi:MAG: preprotein translocase subunit SecE, partial [Firmicutes bacterium]|nr:preprotein translocase subunit SecE [Bacillota bacterium]